MVVVFYAAAVVAVVTTVLALTRLGPIHGLLYLVLSMLAIAVMLSLLGATFIAALEVIIYAGAIVVLFIFVVMLLNQGYETIRAERRWLAPKTWIGPAILSTVLAGAIAYALFHAREPYAGTGVIPPRSVGLDLYGPYLIGLELASFLLLSGLVGAYHLGRRTSSHGENRHGAHSNESRAAGGGDPVRVGAGRGVGAP